MMLSQDGSVWSTTINLHIDSVVSSSIYLELIFPDSVTAVAACTGFSMVLMADDSLWAMGRNFRGQLGDGTKVRKDLFSFVQKIPGAKAVAAGSGHSMMLKQDGSVWSTGRNGHGQLGDGSNTDRDFFV